MLAKKIESFNLKFEGIKIPEISELELIELCKESTEVLPRDVFLSFILNLSYLALNKGTIGRISIETVQRLITKSSVNEEEIVKWLIENLQPLLLRTEDRRRNNVKSGLRPSVGMSSKDDEARRIWKERGGIRSIPLFYVILLHLQHRNVSSNLWWITPGILNLLDDTTDLAGIKLPGVLLLRTFLSNAFKDETHWISLRETGLFKLYEPILLNMCYYLPPSYSSDETLKVWREVFPTLNVLYATQFKNSEIICRKYQGKFLSEFLLQQAIPRINLTSETLAIYTLDSMISLMKMLDTSTLYHMSRIIYTLGEYLVRNPFFTAFEGLLRKTLDTLEVLVAVCPAARLTAHKFDLLALILIGFDKCKQEGKLTEDLTNNFRRLMQSLEAKGCDYSGDKEEVLKYKNVEELFC